MSIPIPTEAFNWETVECDAVISTLPMWNVLDFVGEKNLPDWYVAQIRTIADDRFRVRWLSLYAASHEPIVTDIHPTELGLWFDSSHSGLAGWAFVASAYDSAVAPPGMHLYSCGFASQGRRSDEWIEQHFDLIEKDLKTFYRNIWTDKNVVWK